MLMPDMRSAQAPVLKGQGRVYCTASGPPKHTPAENMLHCKAAVDAGFESNKLPAFCQRIAGQEATVQAIVAPLLPGCGRDSV